MAKNIFEEVKALRQAYCRLLESKSCGINISITEADFEPDGVTLLLEEELKGNKSVSIWADFITRFIYQDFGEWEYVTENSIRKGIRITAPGFDANTFQYKIELFIKCE